MFHWSSESDKSANWRVRKLHSVADEAVSVGRRGEKRRRYREVSFFHYSNTKLEYVSHTLYGVTKCLTHSISPEVSERLTRGGFVAR